MTNKRKMSERQETIIIRKTWEKHFQGIYNLEKLSRKYYLITTTSIIENEKRPIAIIRIINLLPMEIKYIDEFESLASAFLRMLIAFDNEMTRLESEENKQ